MLWLCILLPQLEQAALQNLALWALQWSSQVSGDNDAAALWLEIGASRQLFGGASTLRARIAAELAALGYSARLGIAPTPQGAALLARAGHAHNPATLAALQALLQPLPLSLLALAPEQLAALHSTGLRTIGELLTLPAAALAQRLGPDASRYLQRLCGQASEPLSMLRVPPQFASRCEFSFALTDTTALLFPLQRLLAGLQGYLRSLDRAVQRYALRLEHHQQPATRLEIGLARPTREAAQLLVLARERLAALTLAAPVQALGVEAQEFLQPLVLQLDCFSQSAQQSEQLQNVIDRLVARLGGEAVQRLRVAADHRPERAWSALAAQPGSAATAATAMAAATAAPATAASPLRPCWLLPEPRGIAAPQELLAGPERIESGWWDGADIARDYYLVRGTAGAQWWVYRDLRSGAWHLHGLWA
jgi:protein ImuB